MSSESHQTEGFQAESTRFVRTHLHSYPPAPDWITSSAYLAEGGVEAVLDVGCGPAEFLSSVVDAFQAERGVGVEPSGEAVSLLEAKFRERNPRLEFVQSSAHRLPFDTDSFDVVFCWSVLHWVGRNEYLQALGELVRVTRRHLVVMDFVAAQDYRVSYSHDNRYFTYKSDFGPVIGATGIMRLVEERRWNDGSTAGEMLPITDADLQPFLGNPTSYVSRRACVFVKDYDALPCLSAEDFAGTAI